MYLLNRPSNTTNTVGKRVVLSVYRMLEISRFEELTSVWNVVSNLPYKVWFSFVSSRCIENT